MTTGEETKMTKLKLTFEPGKQDLVMTRDFDTPPDLVFKAHTDPDILPQWWGPRRLTTKVESLDARQGGIWRFIQHDTDGNEYAFNGVFHEIRSPARLVQTFEFEGMPGHVLLETITFEDQNGKTRLTAQSVFQSVEDRDGMMESDMEEGAAESMDRLEELLQELQKSRRNA